MHCHKCIVCHHRYVDLCVTSRLVQSYVAFEMLTTKAWANTLCWHMFYILLCADDLMYARWFIIHTDGNTLH